jgi:serine/threonine-protein kinase
VAALRFGPYETLFRIASGGMAEVFAVRAPDDGNGEQLRAVKRIAPHLAEDRSFVAMFLDEGRVASRVSSRHVVRTLELGQAEDGSLYIAMELVVGVTWAELGATAQKRGEPIPVSIVVEMAAQSADGLHDAHEARTLEGERLELVHRDISPQNLLVGADGLVRVTDFGIARARIARYAHTSQGQRKGKVAYFSPEQSRGEALDHRSDLFSLAIVVWEALAGQRLFGGASYADKIMLLRKAHVPDLCAIRPDVPKAVAAAIARALSASRDDRQATAAELANELRTAAREAGVTATSDDVAVYLARADLPRLASLRAQIRETVARGDVRTMIDLSAKELPDPDTLPLRNASRSDPDATRLLHSPDATRLLHPPDTTMASSPELELTHVHADTVISRAPRPTPPLRLLVLSVAAIVIAAVLLVCLATSLLR